MKCVKVLCLLLLTFLFISCGDSVLLTTDNSQLPGESRQDSRKENTVSREVSDAGTPPPHPHNKQLKNHNG